MTRIKKLLLLVLLFHYDLINAQNPTLEWVKKIGGTSYSGGNLITVDKKGNVYTVGYFDGVADLDPGSGIFNLTCSGGRDVFISKLDKYGNFIWAKQVAGGYAESLLLDELGNLYISFRFAGTSDFDPGIGIVNLTSNGGTDTDVAILKLDVLGNYVWVKQIGGISTEISSRVTLDKYGNLYMTCIFKGLVDFDLGIGISNLFSGAAGSIAILKLDASGNFVWVKKLEGSNEQIPTGIQVDVFGNVYTIGYFYGNADFDPSAAMFNLTSAGYTDIFVSKLDSSGNFIWAKRIGGTYTDEAISLRLDSLANVYVTGMFSNTVDFDPGAGLTLLTAYNNMEDIFILKLNSSGNLLWAKGIGGVSVDYGFSLNLDRFNNVYVTGSFRDTVDFDPGLGAHYLYSATPFGPGDDCYILKLDVSGNFLWVQQLGSPGATEVGLSIALDSIGNIYTTGRFNGTSDFDPNVGVVNLTSNVLYHENCFIHKMNLLSLGLNEIKSKNIVTIFPNPTNGLLNIEVNLFNENMNVMVYNALGQIVLTDVFTTKSLKLNTSALTNGIYFINVMSNNKTLTRSKFVKE